MKHEQQRLAPGAQPLPAPKTRAQRHGGCEEEKRGQYFPLEPRSRGATPRLRPPRPACRRCPTPSGNTGDPARNNQLCVKLGVMRPPISTIIATRAATPARKPKLGTPAISTSAWKVMFAAASSVTTASGPEVAPIAADHDFAKHHDEDARQKKAVDQHDRHHPQG